MQKMLIACSRALAESAKVVDNIEITLCEPKACFELLSQQSVDAFLIELPNWDEAFIKQLESCSDRFLSADIFISDFSSVPSIVGLNATSIQLHAGNIPDDASFLRYVAQRSFTFVRDVPRSGEWTFRKLFLLNPTPMIAYDLESYRILMANKAAVELYGYSEVEFQGLSVMDIRPKEDAEILKKALSDHENRTFYDHGRWRHLKKNGELMYVNILGFNLDFNQRTIRLVAVHNVTDQILREKTLHFQANVLQNVTDSVVATDLEGKVTFFNKGAEAMYGYTEEEMIGKYPIAMYPAFTVASFKETLNHIRKVGSLSQERRAVHANGKELRVRVNSKMLYDAEGNEVGFVGIAKDVTPLYEYMDQVEEKAEQLNHVLESMKDAFFALDFNRTVIQWNEAASSILQVKKEDMIGKHLWEMFPSEVGTKFYTESERCFRVRQPASFIEFFKPLDYWFEVDVIPTNFGVTVFFRNVTEQINITTNLRISNERYRFASLSTNDVIWDWDLKTDFLYLSDTFRKLVKLGKNDPCEGNPTIWSDYVHPEDQQCVLSSLERTISDKDSTLWKESYRMITTEGKVIHVSDSGYVLRNEHGEAIRFVGAIHDETERMEQNAQIAKDLKEKEVLLKEIHHRVKNNMAVINSLLYLYASRASSEAFEEAVTEITQRIKTMALIHDLLYQDKFLGIVDLQAYVNELVTAVQDSYRVNTLLHVNVSIEEIKVELNTAVPLALILNEMLSNAFKHAFNGMKQGEICISARYLNQHILVELSDNGIGFQKELVHEDRLGINLMKDLARQIQAEIQMNSIPGKGTSYQVLVPMK